MTQSPFVVAIHDVTPFHADPLGRIYELLAELGIDRPALLVVPDWHGEWPLADHGAFVGELQRRQAAGAEIFLHGYRHDEAGYRRSLADRVRVFGRTAGSAEFPFLTPGETAERLDRGMGVLREVGLEPVGFVPPAWLFGPHTRPLARVRGLRLTESFGWMEHLETGQRVFAPALSWSTARRWRSRLTAWVGNARLRLPGVQPVMRVSIHPPDIDEPVVRAALAMSLERLVRTRAFVTYRELFGMAESIR